VVLGVAAAGQKKPSAQRLEMSAELASAKQEPAVHAVHAAAPEALYVPGGQAMPTVVMAVAASVWGTLTVYVPAPPVPVPRPVMAVPAATPEPEAAWSTFAATVYMAMAGDTVWETLTVYVPMPPWLEKVRVCAVTACPPTLTVPVHEGAQGLALRPDTVDTNHVPPLLKISAMPFTSEPEATLATLSVAPVIVPVTTAAPSAVTCVSGVVVPPVTNMPTARAPEATADTVSVVAAMAPVKDAATREPTGAGEAATVSVVPERAPVKATEPVPAGQYAPAEQAEPVAAPAAQ